MREINFRATLNKEARSGYDKYQTEIILFSLEDLMRGKVVFAYPEHWQFDRWTGLKDKNGKEIYEGHIVKVIGKIKDPQLIGFDVERAHFCFVYDTGEAMRDINKSEYALLEIIGNIYSHPELLNK